MVNSDRALSLYTETHIFSCTYITHTYKCSMSKSEPWCLFAHQTCFFLFCCHLPKDCRQEIRILEILNFSLFNPLLSLFSSVTWSCLTLCNPTNHSTSGLPVHHQLLESTQTHVHWVGDAIQSSHPLLSPFPPALNLSQHQGLFKWVSSSHEVAKVLEFQLQHHFSQWTPRTDLL